MNLEAEPNHGLLKAIVDNYGHFTFEKPDDDYITKQAKVSFRFKDLGKYEMPEEVANKSSSGTVNEADIDIQLDSNQVIMVVDRSTINT